MRWFFGLECVCIQWSQGECFNVDYDHDFNNVNDVNYDNYFDNVNDVNYVLQHDQYYDVKPNKYNWSDEHYKDNKYIEHNQHYQHYHYDQHININCFYDNLNHLDDFIHNRSAVCHCCEFNVLSISRLLQ